MDKIEHRALTYSLLAHIRTKGQPVSGPIQIFIPLIKRVLSKMTEKGIFSGKSILEIKTEADELYSIDFPIPVLRRILTAIAKEINSESETKFFLFQDDAFQLKNYAFIEFEETIRVFTDEISNLEKLFAEFCHSCNDNKPDSSSILEFIEKNKISLSKYLAHKQISSTKDYTIEAQFVEFFKGFPPIYEIIRKIYLGSILASYIEYKTENLKTGIELLFDTNFLLGLLDLNTPESTLTCKKIIDITKSQGYKLTVLKDTINETISLLKAKSENFDMSFLQKKVYPEDIYNACERRNLSKVDLEKITDGLESVIARFGINIISDTSKFKNTARFSQEYELFKQFRYNDLAALHDATAIYYVRSKRGKKIKDFENVNCWFINNSINREKYVEHDIIGESQKYQPESIKADDFLNIIWLSNPQINLNVDIDEISDIGLTSLISLGLTDSLPKLSIIQELDDNIYKYAQDSDLTDNDIIRIATRITTKQLTDLEDINLLAKNDREKFVKRLNHEAKKQKEQEEERIKRLERIYKEITAKSLNLSKITKDLESKASELDLKVAKLETESGNKEETIERLKKELQQEKDNRKKDENKHRLEKREDYITTQVKKWQNKVKRELLLWCFLLILFIFLLLLFSGWNLNRAFILLNQEANVLVSFLALLVSTAFSAITLKKWYDRNHNLSNIESFKKSLKIPEELQEIK